MFVCYLVLNTLINHFFQRLILLVYLTVAAILLDPYFLIHVQLFVLFFFRGTSRVLFICYITDTLYIYGPY